eukprot:GILK01005247.1.p1 GENE.GILK01005247.1~~GILK01005247.1.p1  ORF type:complete len:608 (+),score=62.50 GILK01005247.1:117-1826(+)
MAINSFHSVASAPQERHELKQSLTTLPLVGLTFFAVCGAAFGIEDAIKAAGPLYCILAILIFPWLYSFPLALITMELSTAIPENGGYIVWADRAFGSFFAFQNGVWKIASNAVNLALFPVLFSSYLHDIFPWANDHFGHTAWWAVGMLSVLVTSLLNFHGVEDVGRAAVWFLFLVLLPFIFMFGFGLPHMSFSAMVETLPASTNVHWGMLFIVVLWNNSGYDNVGVCSGEIKDISTTFPKAIVITLFLVIATYLFPVMVAVSYARDWTLWSAGYLPQVAEMVGGRWLGVWMGITGSFSALGMLNTLLCTSSRALGCMADLHFFPKFLGSLHPKYNTPYIAIACNSLFVSIATYFLNFQAIVQVNGFMYALTLLMEYSAFLWLRYRQPELHRPYKVPLSTLGCCLMCIPPVALCFTQMALVDSLSLIISASTVALALLCYIPLYIFGGGRWPAHLFSKDINSTISSSFLPYAGSAFFPKHFKDCEEDPESDPNHVYNPPSTSISDLSTDIDSSPNHNNGSFPDSPVSSVCSGVTEPLKRVRSSFSGSTGNGIVSNERETSEIHLVHLDDD